MFGAPFPGSIPDEFHLTPLTSYGTQKAICELLLADYTRRGFLDGVGIRLPTICVRPGKPNKAASGFFSGIIREPLAGQEAMLPVAESVRHTHASPRAAVGFLIHAAGLTREQLGPRVNLAMPGVSLHRRRADRGASPRRRRQGGRAHPPRAGRAGQAHRLRLGRANRCQARTRPRVQGRSRFDDIVRAHIEDELGGKIAELIASTNAALAPDAANLTLWIMTYVDAAVAPLRKTGQIKIHGPAAFEGMRKAGQLVARCLDMLTEHVGRACRPRTSTGWSSNSPWTTAPCRRR